MTQLRHSKQKAAEWAAFNNRKLRVAQLAGVYQLGEVYPSSFVFNQ